MFQSSDELVKMLTETRLGTQSQLEWGDMKLILQSSMVNTILCDNPTSKNIFLTNIVLENLKPNSVSIYIDLHTFFTVHIKRIEKPIENLGNLVIMIPRENTLDEIIAYVSSIHKSKVNMITLDSVTTFYQLFRNGSSFGDLNRRLGVYLSILKSCSQAHKSIVLIASLARSRNLKGSWVISYSGGRALKKISDVILRVRSDQKRVEVDVLKHPLSELSETVLALPRVNQYLNSNHASHESTRSIRQT